MKAAKLFSIMHYSKIDFMIVSILIITIQSWLRFVANAFLIANILETIHLLDSPNFTQKLLELKDLQNNHNKKIAKFLTLSS